MKNITAKTLEELSAKVNEGRKNGMCVIGGEVFKSENGFSVIMDVDYSKQPESSHIPNVVEYAEKFGIVSERTSKKGKKRMVTLEMRDGTMKEFFYSESVTVYGGKEF